MIVIVIFAVDLAGKHREILPPDPPQKTLWLYNSRFEPDLPMQSLTP